MTTTYKRQGTTRNPADAPIEVPPGSDFAIEGLYCGLVRTE